MFDKEIVDWIKKKKIKLPPCDTREIHKYSDDFQVNICNLNMLSESIEDGAWLVTFETNFGNDDIEIWNGFIINSDKEIINYEN